MRSSNTSETLERCNDMGNWNNCSLRPFPNSFCRVARCVILMKKRQKKKNYQEEVFHVKVRSQSFLVAATICLFPAVTFWMYSAWLHKPWTPHKTSDPCLPTSFSLFSPLLILQLRELTAAKYLPSIDMLATLSVSDFYVLAKMWVNRAFTLGSYHWFIHILKWYFTKRRNSHKLTFTEGSLYLFQKWAEVH